MLSKRKRQREEAQLLQDTLQMQNEWTRLMKIMDQSIEPSESGRFELMVAEAKYFYLLKEVRHYHLNMKVK
ncbi:YaaL family protein [Amphibacillus sp. MSJ-3]|uniref:YaaL family protein n=1 Tax=Amphibacillus sp. MSJ-3 TaxID=2841505 RepID=UPI001C0EFCB7|nr:YaaL family protein [Amphibacillus sp. MSJ-3]MBU5594418.1 YaaL family protein [Amphibacillus sp. MSJ-3]